MDAERLFALGSEELGPGHGLETRGRMITESGAPATDQLEGLRP